MLVISGISIEVCKKDIKNMHLYVKPPNGHVTVSAPLTMSDEAIERFVRTKTAWIRNQVEKFDVQLRQSEREHVSGETLYVWGKRYYLQVEHGTGKNSLTLKGEKAILTVREKSTPEQRDRFVKEWHRGILKKEISLRLPKWEKVTGLKCDAWQTKYMTTRWGTCNINKRKIWINLQLAKKTHRCLDYIILHELLHLAEKKHNDRFIMLMDRYMPYWRDVKAELNDQALDFIE